MNHPTAGLRGITKNKGVIDPNRFYFVIPAFFLAGIQSLMRKNWISA
jgi:hypothetical protein